MGIYFLKILKLLTTSNINNEKMNIMDFRMWPLVSINENPINDSITKFS